MRGLLLLCVLGCVVATQEKTENSNAAPKESQKVEGMDLRRTPSLSPGILGLGGSNSTTVQGQRNGTSVNLNGTSNATETRPEIDPKPADTKETKVQPEKASGSQSEPKKKMKKRTKNPPRRPSTGVWHGLSSSSGFPTQSPEGNVDQLLPDQRNDTSVNLNGTSNATETRPEIDPKPADTKETKVQPEKAGALLSTAQEEKKKRITRQAHRDDWHGLSTSSGFPTQSPEGNVD
ncbi:uncharacterized protein LOC108230249 isoform X2 [Kryptolebias marmoratus]|uniref:uncharacterized protein LOC108230249 isoform X2 n=1 Tax=Kryptolebias marmoratus TaxID=37003 RepID=UPI0007F8F947|nr:uncharacterized protein LOC108230249 isoform X2 [Kryptolebias marmoratus]